MATCTSIVEICAARATRLATDGSVDPDPDNSYVVRDIIQLQYTANIREGDEREMLGGCGCVIAQKTDDDQLRRFDLELQLGRFEPGFLEMALGGTVIEATAGPIGFLYGAKRDCGVPQPRVAFEAWAKNWTEDDEQSPTLPWVHLLWPAVAFSPAQNTLSSDFGPYVLNGKTRANTSWGTGPYGDAPASLAANQIGIWEEAGDLPTATCDYTTVAT
jgi:hypothetical protein